MFELTPVRLVAAAESADRQPFKFSVFFFSFFDPWLVGLYLSSGWSRLGYSVPYCF